MTTVSIGQALKAASNAVTAQQAERAVVVAAATASQSAASTAAPAGVSAATPEGDSGDRPA